MTDYDARKDGIGSYYDAIAAKRAKMLHERCPSAKRVEVIGDCVLYLGDMRSVVPTLFTFDLCLTDPPYGINENDKKVASRGKLAAPKDYGYFDWDQSAADADQMRICREASQHQIIFGGNYFELPPTSCWLVWDKQNGDNDFADCELAWTNLPKAVRRIHWRWNGMIRKGSDVREHPTQKPVGVMEWCLSQVPTAKSVIDPFMGSGTTGVACAKRGLVFHGVEMHEQYFDIACERIRKAYAQPDMFIEAAKPKAEQLSMLGEAAE